jgi:AcrR family transcriptional regulator
VSAEPGLRERKKQQTRARITDTAIELFADRGFDKVTVAEIARLADVSEATVFNYFPTKEDLVYDGMEAFEQALLESVSNRPEGTSVLSAFREFVLQPRGALIDSDPAGVERIAVIARIVAGSSALQGRERQTFDRYTRELAKVFAEELGSRSDEVEPWVAANALMGVNRAMKETVHRQALAGHSGRRIAKDVVACGRRALDLLERGLG